MIVSLLSLSVSAGFLLFDESQLRTSNAGTFDTASRHSISVTTLPLDESENITDSEVFYCGKVPTANCTSRQVVCMSRHREYAFVFTWTRIGCHV